MDKVFGDYARYYDLLYRDKDYAAEAEYVSGLLKRNAPDVRRVLDVGCGTARHDVELSRLGYAISGVDLSEAMLAEARRRLPGGEFLCASSENFSFQHRFDAVVSLFHVMSYHTTLGAAVRFMSNAAGHLRPGGLFIFDFWNGDAVKKDPPTCRTKEFADEQMRVTRRSTPDHNVADHTVNVHFDVEITDIASGRRTMLTEDHLMRYWFADELNKLAAGSGFEYCEGLRYMTDEPISADDWNAILVFRKAAER